MDKNIVISIKTILLTALMGLALYVIFELGKILGLLFVALLLTLSLEHTVKFFMAQKIMNKNIHRSLAVLITYLSVFGVLSLAITVGMDPVITQTQKLIQMLLRNQDVLSFGNNFNLSLSEFVSGFAKTSDGVINATKSIFGNVAAISSILVLSIYLSIDWENIKKGFIDLFPDKYNKKVTTIIREIEFSVGHWLRGELILMLFIGVLSYVGLLVVGVEFALPLAIISGIFEIIPIMGPLFSAVVAALVAAVSSPVKAVLVVLVFWVIQGLENNLIVPKVMQRVSGFRPITILIALLVGSHLFGVVGAITAVPVLIMGTIILKNTVFG